MKEKLEKRRISIQDSYSSEDTIRKDKCFENLFINSLNEGKRKLKHVEPPLSPNFGLGRVVPNPTDSVLNESSDLSWDSTEEIIQYDDSMFNDNILYEPPKMFIKYGDENFYTDEERDVIEYYEGITNSNPIRRKIMENSKRLSM